MMCFRIGFYSFPGEFTGASLGVALAMAWWGVSPLATQWLALLGLSGDEIADLKARKVI